MSTQQQLRILVLGHSFVWRLEEFILNCPLPCISYSFNCTIPNEVNFYGTGGRTVEKLRQYDLTVVEQFGPNIIILEIGSNDLCNPRLDPNSLATNMFQLVQMLHFTYQVSHIIISQALPRRTPPRMTPSYNTRVTQFTRVLQHLVRVTSFATLWFHPQFLQTRETVFLRDGVHLNFAGNHMLYHSYQKALMYCLSRRFHFRSNSRPLFIRRPRCYFRPRHQSRRKK